jgi:hypothetical protein
MHMPRFLALVALAMTVAFDASLTAVEPPTTGRQTFGDLFATIKPRGGQSRWMEIDWHPSVWEARKRAAAEGKPILLMAGSGGAPAAGC